MQMANEQLLKQAEKLISDFATKKGEYRALLTQLHNNEKSYEDLKNRHKLDLKRYEMNRGAVEVVKKLIERLSAKGITKLESLLTYGLNTIFSDREYSISIEVKERGDVKTAEIWLVETLVSGRQRKCKLRDSVGGGVQVTVSLIIRVYFILVLGLRRVVIMDETFTEVADEYLPGLFEFIRNTIDELSFRYLLITHDPRFTEFVDRQYRMTNGDAQEK